MAPSIPRTYLSDPLSALVAQVVARLQRAGWALFVVATLAGASPSLAACALVVDPDHTRAQMLQCGASLTAHLAEGAKVRPVGDASSVPGALRLRKGALLIEFRPHPGVETFQFLTPEAIAAVRGTTWAVEVNPGKTSMFVVAGRVEVKARSSDAEVSLGAGEGVDGERAAKTLEVKRWGEDRVRKLLARFGR